MGLLEILGQTSAWTWLAIVAALVFAALAHGAIGFGYPLISMPLVALLTDVRTAVLTTLLPNIIINVISVVRGHRWRETMRHHWPVAAYVLLGTIVGTRALALADTRLLELLLAAMIVAHLLQGPVRAVAARWIARNPRAAPLAFGSVAGFFSGTVNVAVPPLLVYFSALEMPPLEMTQALNLSFLVGRSTQIAANIASGQLASGLALLSLPLSLISVLALFGGFRLQGHIRPEVFARLLRAVLWGMAAMLSGQAVLAYLR